jgi:hypothetical protein
MPAFLGDELRNWRGRGHQDGQIHVAHPEVLIRGGD